jgi:hypothetical protein
MTAVLCTTVAVVFGRTRTVRLEWLEGPFPRIHRAGFAKVSETWEGGLEAELDRLIEAPDLRGRQTATQLLGHQ